MPKLKTHKGAAKRFKKTASGKFKFQRAFKRHLLEVKSSKRKRQARVNAYVSPSFTKELCRMLPYC